jgi:CheY-like chemotaxis protein
MVQRELQILIIEDDPADALRLVHELRKCGFSFQSQTVETKRAFLKAVQEPPDLILSDHGLPSFSGFAALDIVRERCPEVPFIFVTGSYDQGSMVEMFESGAAGYVYKNHLSDLKPAIEHALKERLAQTATSAAEIDQHSSEPISTRIPAPEVRRDQVLLCSRCKKVLNNEAFWEDIEQYLRRNQQAVVTLALCPECAMTKYPGLQL